MNVLLVTDISGNQVGGVASAMVDLVGGLAYRGHHVGLVNDSPFPGMSRLARHYVAPEARDAKFAHLVADAIISMSPDVVHVNHMGQQALQRLLPVLAKTRWILTVHSVSPMEKILPAFHARERLHYLARDTRYLANTLGWRFLFMRGAVPYVLVHSEFARRTLQRYGQAAHRISVIELGSSKAEVVPMMPYSTSPTRNPTIVTVGGYAHTKGQHDALKAAGLLRRRFPGIRYRMTGETRDPTYMAYLRSLASQLGIASAVSFGERLGEPVKMAWLQEADVYVQPSHEEGFCLAYLEAARLSQRLVGTDTGAIRQIGADDGAMRTIPPRDPSALAAAIAGLLDQPSPTPEALRKRYERLQHRFSVERYVAAHEALYMQICSPNRRSALSLNRS